MTTERLDLIVALAIKNLQHPNRNSFPSFARQVLTVKCNASPAVITTELKSLMTAWAADKWATIIQGNPYNITEEEVELWERNFKRVSCII